MFLYLYIFTSVSFFVFCPADAIAQTLLLYERCFYSIFFPPVVVSFRCQMLEGKQMFTVTNCVLSGHAKM